MRPSRAPLHVEHGPTEVATLRTVAMASFTPRGATRYDAAKHLRRRVVALRGGANAIAVVFAWVHGAVRVKIVACGECSSEDAERAIVAARDLAAVDDDPTEFLASIKRHPVLGPLAREADPRLSKTPTVFETFAVAVIEQLVTGFEARASVRRLWRIAGEVVPTTKLVAAPTARAVRNVPMWRMHEIGVGSRRAATLREGALRGDALERLRTETGEVAIAKLQSLPGVGPWTANYVARDALGYSDAVPIGDFHGPFIIAEALGDRHDLTRDDPKAADDAMLELLEPFRPHRARVASMLETQSVKKGRWRPPKVDAHRREPWRY